MESFNKSQIVLTSSLIMIMHKYNIHCSLLFQIIITIFTYTANASSMCATQQTWHPCIGSLELGTCMRCLDLISSITWWVPGWLSVSTCTHMTMVLWMPHVPHLTLIHGARKSPSIATGNRGSLGNLDPTYRRQLRR